MLSTAGVARPSPSEDDAPSGVHKKHVQDALDARAQTRKSAEGAKEKTLQPNSTDQRPNHTNASSGEPTIGACAVSMAGSSQPPNENPRRNDPPRSDGPNAAMRGKGSDVQDSHSDSDSFSHSPAAAQGMEVEPSGGRASSPSSATDVFRALATPGGSSSKAPALAPVPERGEKGGNSRGKNLSDGGLSSQKRAQSQALQRLQFPKSSWSSTTQATSPSLPCPIRFSAPSRLKRSNAELNALITPCPSWRIILTSKQGAPHLI